MKSLYIEDLEKGDVFTWRENSMNYRVISVGRSKYSSRTGWVEYQEISGAKRKWTIEYFDNQRSLLLVSDVRKKY